MVLEKKYLFFKTLRIVLDDEALARALSEKMHSYITGVSYNGNMGNGVISVRSKKTPVIDLPGRSDDDFLMSANETTRNEIRRTFKTPELSFHLPDENRMGIHKLYSELEKAGGRSMREFDYFQESIFAGAYHEQKLVAAIICYDQKPHLRVHAIISLRKSEPHLKKFISFATRRLIFELAKYGRSREYVWLDLGGVNLKDEAKAGIDSFKLSFGARLVDEHTYTYESRLFKYAGFIFNKRG